MAPDRTTSRWCSFAFLCAAVLLSPWFFGAWETWWFWPFASCIFASALFFSLDLAAGKLNRITRRRTLAACGLSCALFLLYALVRCLQAEVFMDAERAFLLFLTPCIIAAVVILHFSRQQLRLLYVFVVVDLFCVGLYGLINHRFTNSTRVMWVASDYAEQYAGRATGSYFCPDHFSGIMELLCALALALLLGAPLVWSRRGNKNPGSSLLQRMLSLALLAIGMCGIWLSASRGGGLTLLVTLAAAVLLGMRHLRPLQRWVYRLSFLAVMAGAIAAAWYSNTGYVTRFKDYFGWSHGKTAVVHEAREEGTFPYLKKTARYNMYAAAFRAWKTKPCFGIGPGMHKHVWPRFAPSPDGDREHNRWPTRPNIRFYSYEVHSDWLQMLEEYGIVGLLLFLAAFVCTCYGLLRGTGKRTAQPVVFGGVLCLVAMAFHSLGDFNLQMPATTWLMGAVLGISLAFVVRKSA